jgi:competence protein ComEC
MRRPLLVLFLAWITGLLLSDYLYDPAAVLLAMVVGITVLFGAILSGKSQQSREILHLLALLMVLLGFLRHTLAEQAYQRKLNQILAIVPASPSYVRGTLASQFQRADERRWTVQIKEPTLWDGKTWQPLPGPVEVVSTTETQPAGESGQSAEFTGRWRPIEGSSSSGHRDLRGWQQSTGILGTLKIREGATSLEEPPHLPLLAQLTRARDHWRSRIREWMLSQFPGEAGGLALAMTTGERGYLSEAVRRNLLESGLYHLTAVSGLNVTIVLLTLPLFLKVLGVPRRWRALLGIPLAFLLLSLVGAQVSVLRATFMGIALMLALFMDRPNDALNTLAAAGLIILVLYPSELHQAGFLLSFLTVAALVLGGLHRSTRPYQLEIMLQKWFKPGVLVHSLVNALAWMAAGLWASLVATLAVAPVSAWFFHTVAWKAVLANLVAIPIAEMITVLGVLAAFGLAFVPGLGVLLTSPIFFLSTFLLGILEWVSSWTIGFSVVLSPDLVIIALLLAMGLVFLVPVDWFRPPLLSRRVTALLLLAGLSWWPLLPESREFRLHFLDVGQGDACLLQFPHGESLLVDTGPPAMDRPNRLGALTCSLLSLGIRHIDAVVISHPEADHVGGLPQVLETFPVGKIFATGDTNESPSFVDLSCALKTSQLPTGRLLAGDHLTGIRDATVTALYPSVDEIHHPFGTRNERSLVLLVEQAGLKVLLPGDITGDVEQEIIEKYPGLDCDILKVAHHGSRFSSESGFLQKVSPALAVIQCGDNLFGHPSLETVQRLEEVGATVLTTRSDGAIQLTWNGVRLAMNTERMETAWRP